VDAGRKRQRKVESREVSAEAARLPPDGVSEYASFMLSADGRLPVGIWGDTALWLLAEEVLGQQISRLHHA